MKKRSLSLLLCLVMLLGAAAGCKPASTPGQNSGSGSSSPSVSTPGSTSTPDVSQPGNVSTPEGPGTSQTVPAKMMVLSGPTGVGAAKLMADNEAAGSAAALEISVVSDNSEVSAALVNVTDPIDIACVATNVASNLYNKTGGKIQVLAVNTTGVLYILEKGQSVTSMASLKGKTIYATGQGANPEYILSHLLRENGLDPEKDVDIQWMTAQEVTAKMVASSDGVCMLPVPAATALLMKDQSVRQALDLSAEWDEIADSPLVMGCVVARTQFVQEHPDQVAQFLEQYRQSISYMSDPANLDAAAELVARFGITANAQIAKAAIPQCNLTFLDGVEMRQAIQGYYEVLFEADPASIGGGNPDDDFYYLP